MLHKPTILKTCYDVIIFWHEVILKKVTGRFSCVVEISLRLIFGSHTFGRTTGMESIFYGIFLEKWNFKWLALNLGL